MPKISVGESFSVALIFGEEGGGYQKFTSKCFCLTVPTKFSVVESFIVALILGIEKVWRRGGGIKIFGRKFLPQIADENFRRGLLYCCINFWGRGGGGIKILRRKFFVSQCRRKFPQANPLLLHQFRVSKKFGGEGGGYQDFPSKIFCLTVPTKNSVGESFIVALFSGIEKVWRRGGGGSIKVFRRKYFVSQRRIFP